MLVSAVSGAEFDAWQRDRGVFLTAAQRRAAHGLLAAARSHAMFAGRATGKTFVMHEVEDFLSRQPPRAAE